MGAEPFLRSLHLSSVVLLRGDTDNTILMYDMSRLSASGTSLPEKPTLTYYEHGVCTERTRQNVADLKLQDSIRAISCHPTQDEIFLSARQVV